MKTALFDFHARLGARMVPFAGYDMPIQYPEGIKAEHAHTRHAASLFDVSHMGQILLKGEKAAEILENVTASAFTTLKDGKQRYTVFTNDKGGIEDDLMVTRTEDAFFIIVNASRKEEDRNRLQEACAGTGVSLSVLTDRALLALQGPKAAGIFAKFCPEAADLFFMEGGWFDCFETRCFITRSGYTGEDGFEISVPAGDAERIAETLLSEDGVAPCGLGARDILRLEAGLCLYGEDIGEDTTPIEADLKWILQKSRRENGGFPGADTILSQLENGAPRKRVGLTANGRQPIRHGTLLKDLNGNEVGIVTSGTVSPILEAPIAMGYVRADLTESGTPLIAVVRGKELPVTISSLPFVPHRYHRKK